jgi:hypothetical protein
LKNTEEKENPARVPLARTLIKTIKTGFSENPSRRALGILEKALEKPDISGGLSANLSAELGSLFFPGRTAPPRNELIEALYSLAGNRGSP